jgi:hypothetical protein
MKKSAFDNRVRFFISQILIIFISALIPIINTIPRESVNLDAIKIASSLFGFIIISSTRFVQKLNHKSIRYHIVQQQNY